MGGKKKLLNEEQEEFFKQHQKGLLLQEAADLMNDTFGLSLTARQVRDQRVRLGVGGGKFFIPHPSRRLFNEEQLEFFKQHQQGLLRSEVAELMNRTFGLNITATQVKEQRTDLKLKAGKIDMSGGRLQRNGGMFKQGGVPHNHLPVGSEVVKTDGYLWRKVAEPNAWKQVHLILWEEAHGPREKGHKVIFLNGNKQDVRLENLACVTDSENAYLNSRGLRFTDAELTRSGVAVARLLSACNSRRKKGGRG